MERSRARLSANAKEGLFYLLVCIAAPLLVYGGFMVLEPKTAAPAFVGMDTYLTLFLRDEIFIRSIFNTYLLPVYCILPVACLSMWLAGKLDSARPTIRTIVGIVSLTAALAVIFAGFILAWSNWTSAFYLCMALVGVGGGLLFLPSRLLGNHLKQRHGVFRPVFQILAAVIAAECAYLPFYLCQLREYLTNPNAYPFSGRPVPSALAMANMFLLALFICLLTWCLAGLYRLVTRKTV